MDKNINAAPKPRAEVIRPQITRLPELTFFRRVYRIFFIRLIGLAVRSLVRIRVRGLENVPRRGPALIVANHLGDADALVLQTYIPIVVEFIAKAELYDYPILGKFADTYGVIWLHRGQPDRRAIRAALEGLRQGRVVVINPEARESLTGALEEGTGGAAYLALKAGVPVLPITFTGTENNRVYANLKRLRRTDITLTIGPAFRLEQLPDRQEAIDKGTQKIMEALAAQLPLDYRGVYSRQDESRPGAMQSHAAEE